MRTEVAETSHALRLACQGLEVARDGRLTLPLPEAERRRVVAVKRGDGPQLADVLAEIDQVRAQVQQLLDDGGTPLAANRTGTRSTAGRCPRTADTGAGPDTHAGVDT